MNPQVIQRGRNLEYATIGYNMLEAIVAITFGGISGSVALISFGVDSILEVASGGVMIWRLGSHSTEAERLAQKLIALSFFALGAWILFESAAGLINREGPVVSWPGIVLAALSIVVMPALARAKRQVGFALQSSAMVADSRQTHLCAWLSAILLAGLLLQVVFGWWWADAVASLAMVPIIASEGINAWRGNACGCTQQC